MFVHVISYWPANHTNAGWRDRREGREGRIRSLLVVGWMYLWSDQPDIIPWMRTSML